MTRALSYPRQLSIENFRVPNFQLVAELLEWIVGKWVPYAFDAYRVYRKGAITFSAHEALMIRAALAMPSLSEDEKPVWADKLSMREWKAFTVKIAQIT